MKADAVIFDKDGTLLDFDAFWVSVSVKAIAEVLARFEMTDAPTDGILEALGVRGGSTDIDSVLCKGTYAQMGEVVYGVLRRYGCKADRKEVTEAVIDAYNRNSDSGEVRPTSPNLREVLTELKSKKKKLAVITTDNAVITRKCLEKLGIEDLFDKIYTDDGHTPPKPSPYCAVDFCEKIGVRLEDAVMVGDTATDIEFAKNAGIPAVILAKTDKSKELFSPYADAVIGDLSELTKILE